MRISRRYALATCATVLTGGCLGRTPFQPGSPTPNDPPDAPWSQYRADAGRTGRMPPYAGPDNSASVSRLKQIKNGRVVQPVARDERIYLASNEGLEAYNHEGEYLSGSSLAASTQTPPARGEQYLFASGSTYIGAFQSDVSDTAWHHFLESEVRRNPTLHDGTVYLSTEAGDILGFDAADGTETLRIPLRQHTQADPPYIQPLAIDDEHVYAGSEGHLAAFDADSGELVWQRTDLAGRPEPFLGEDRVFVATDKGLWALDKRDGTEHWRFDDQEAPASQPAIGESTVYVNAGAQKLFALDKASGTERWSRPESEVGHVPCLSGDTLYLAPEGKLVALDAPTGETWFTKSVFGDRTLPVTIAYGAAFVVSIHYESAFIEMIS